MRRFPTALLFSAALMTGAAAAQDVDTYGLWRVSCEDGPCQAFFSLQSPDTGEVVLSMAIIHDRSSDSSALVLRTPLVTALEPGMLFSVDEVDLSDGGVRFQFCDSEGCTAFLPLDDAKLSAMMAAETGTMTYFQYGEPVPTAYSFPLEGFAEARERLRE